MHRFFLTVAIFLSASFSVSAAPVVWTVNNAQFADGGTLAGSFAFDANTLEYSDVALTTTAGSSAGFQFAGSQTYSSATYGTFLGLQELITSSAPISCDGGLTCLTDLRLDFASALTSSGGTIGILTDFQTQEGVERSDDLVNARLLISGTITAVPVPAAVWLFGSGLVGLGWLRRRQIS